ncbi:hypothetical protein ACFLRP_02045 [Bacteroidota bacterium]
MIEKIEKDGNLIAVILRGNYESEGVDFITDDDNPLQVGVLTHPRGSEIKPHVHRSIPREISSIQEVLHIERGVVEALIYDDSGAQFGSWTLNADDTILLITGGHGFNILEDAKILEVKQGPYLDASKDKSRLEIKY